MRRNFLNPFGNFQNLFGSNKIPKGFEKLNKQETSKYLKLLFLDLLNKRFFLKGGFINKDYFIKPN